MDQNELHLFYQRDIQKLVDEITLFKDDANIWKTCGSVKNSVGNLALHLIGGLNYLIGTLLGGTGYVRNRESELSASGVDKAEVIEQLKELKAMVYNTVSSLTKEQFESPFPIFFDKEDATIGYVLNQLLLHLNYHLGQINYLRRVLE